MRGALAASGVGVEAALTATLLLRGFTFWLPMLPGIVIVRREVRDAEDERSTVAPLAPRSGASGPAKRAHQA